MSLRTIDLDASKWTSVIGFYDDVLRLLGAPDWHGHNFNALLETLIYGLDVCSVKPPYIIRISGFSRIEEGAKSEIEWLQDEVRRNRPTDPAYFVDIETVS